MNPPLVEVTRGGRVESLHRGAVAVVSADGEEVFAAGDLDAAVYPRSAVKAFQALPLVASGAADHLGLTDAEIALACGSHAGERIHVVAAAAMLAKAGRDPACLECGAHWPLDDTAARDLAAKGQTPSALHNNCSGKHAGLICLSCFRGNDPAGYTQPDHPAMREMTAMLSAVLAETLDERNRAVDGCSIPTYAIPLRSLAAGFARFATGTGLADDLAAAALRIRRAIADHPQMLAGPGRFDTRIIDACGGNALVKSGAEGVVCACIPAAGLGLAVKIDDGAARAAQAVMALLLRTFLPPSARLPLSALHVLEECTAPSIRNWRNTDVGVIRASSLIKAMLQPYLRHYSRERQAPY